MLWTFNPVGIVRSGIALPTLGSTDPPPVSLEEHGPDRGILIDQQPVPGVGGRLVIIGLMGGAKAEIPLGALLTKRLQVIGSTLRARPDAEKAALVDAFEARFGDALAAGRIRPIIDRVFALADAPEAHRVMKASTHFGKLVLEI